MMKQLAIKSAVLAALGIMTAPAMATGFVTLPTTGFTVGSGTSPYTLCNQTGNYGSAESTDPTSTANNTCAVFPTNINTSPDTASASTLMLSTNNRAIVMNNSYTNNTNITVATVDERIWRNADSTVCIYGTRLRMANVDYWTSSSDTEGGTQYLEVNGFARAGFSGFTSSNSIQIAYWMSNVSDDVLFRSGRTYTSVQHRASLTDETVAATGYVAQPLTASSTASVAITGVSTYDNPLLTPTAAQQSAALASNWVEYTLDANWEDDDGTNLPDTPMLYVKVSGTNACPATSGGTPVLTSNAYSFRQTGQEEAPLLEFKASGYVPSGASVSF
jgi:hypothetical protein